MSEFEHRPLDEDYEVEQKVETPTTLELEDLETDLRGAATAEGADQVAKALTQVATGQARPEELLEWIDDLRAPEGAIATDDEVPAGFLHDFAADTERAAGEVDIPPHGGGDAPDAEAQPTDPGLDDDVQYLYSVTRRRRGDDEDEHDDEGKPLGTEEETPKKS